MAASLAPLLAHPSPRRAPAGRLAGVCPPRCPPALLPAEHAEHARPPPHTAGRLSPAPAARAPALPPTPAPTPDPDTHVPDADPRHSRRPPALPPSPAPPCDRDDFPLLARLLAHETARHELARARLRRTPRPSSPPPPLDTAESDPLEGEWTVPLSADAEEDAAGGVGEARASPPPAR